MTTYNDFNKLVDEAYELLENNFNNELVILPKNIIELTPTRTHWKNVKEYLQVIYRHPDHFMSWLKKIYPGINIDWFSKSISKGLIIHSKGFKMEDINNIALKYIEQCVKCPSCKKIDTILNKSCDVKQYCFECQKCGFTQYIE